MAEAVAAAAVAAGVVAVVAVIVVALVARALPSVVDAAIDRRERERMERARVQRPREVFRSGMGTEEDPGREEAADREAKAKAFAGKRLAGLAIARERSS